ncbi:MAG: FKBP-type peptidyl-prolyl cis-trans isomerase [Bacteroidales bacterium]|nr:FKBP-type peptidyl-prolyl cis-trans isomerase [Candidatus Minthousia equi]
MAQENKYITVAYELYTEMGGQMELTEKAPAEHPFQFISGLGFTLEAFEKNILALSKGEKFDFTLTPEEGYGEYFPEAVQDLPRNIFEINGKFDSERIAEGQVIPLMNADGERFNATVVEVTSDHVKVDLNHPLAGKSLNFKGEVVEMRDATNKELQDMVTMMSGEGGCGGCGGHCGGDCGGNCGGDCGSECGGGCGNCK